MSEWVHRWVQRSARAKRVLQDEWVSGTSQWRADERMSGWANGPVRYAPISESFCPLCQDPMIGGESELELQTWPISALNRCLIDARARYLSASAMFHFFDEQCVWDRVRYVRVNKRLSVLFFNCKPTFFGCSVRYDSSSLCNTMYRVIL